MNAIARFDSRNAAISRQMGEILLTRCQSRIRPEEFAAIYMEIAGERGSKFPLVQRHCSLEGTQPV
jgi:hypothetical protein